MNNNVKLAKKVKVTVEAEYEVDINDLDPKYVNIEGFIRDEATRMFKDDIEHNQLDINVEDFTPDNGSEVIIQVKNGNYLTLQFASDDEHVEGCDSSIECCEYNSNKELLSVTTYDFNSEDMQYDDIKDAITDCIDIVYNTDTWHSARYYKILPLTITQFLS